MLIECQMLLNIKRIRISCTLSFTDYSYPLLIIIY